MAQADEMADARQRLLLAGGEVFAERGFACSTVRDICCRAGANVAAINYHFGGKEQLYSEVLRHWANVSTQKYPANMGVTEHATAEEKLFAFVHSFLLRTLDAGKPSWYGRLIAREMVEPTHGLDERIEETLRPMLKLLDGIILEVVGPGHERGALRRAASSVVGQIVFYRHCRPVLDRMYGEQNWSPQDIEELAKHVTAFSLAGLRMMRRN